MVEPLEQLLEVDFDETRVQHQLSNSPCQVCDHDSQRPGGRGKTGPQAVSQGAVTSETLTKRWRETFLAFAIHLGRTSLSEETSCTTALAAKAC